MPGSIAPKPSIVPKSLTRKAETDWLTLVQRSSSLAARTWRIRLKPQLAAPSRRGMLRNGITSSANQPSSVTVEAPSQIASQGLSKRWPFCDTRMSPMEPPAPIWKKYAVRRFSNGSSRISTRSSGSSRASRARCVARMRPASASKHHRPM